MGGASNFNDGLPEVLAGGTDGTPIGNVNDRLKVDVQMIPTSVSFLNHWTYKVRSLDMNSSNGGIDRGTSVTSIAWSTLYSRSGAGFLSGFIINTETFGGWRVRILVDSVDILIGSTGILTDDITSDTIYDLDVDLDISQMSIGMSKGSHDRFIYTCPSNIPIYFSTSLQILLKRDSGGSKKFQAGLINLSLE